MVRELAASHTLCVCIVAVQNKSFLFASNEICLSYFLGHHLCVDHGEKCVLSRTLFRVTMCSVQIVL